MPINDDMIRLSTWIQNADYQEMHKYCVEDAVSHTDFVRLAIKRELTARRMDQENLFKMLAKAQNGKGVKQA